MWGSDQSALYALAKYTNKNHCVLPVNFTLRLLTLWGDVVVENPYLYNIIVVIIISFALFICSQLIVVARGQHYFKISCNSH